MNLWIRSTAKTNLLQARFLTIMEGKTFYKENEWEYKGYTICNVALDGNYELLGTYKTKERAIEILDEIQEAKLGNFHYRCPSNVKISSKEDTIIYQMPEN